MPRPVLVVAVSVGLALVLSIAPRPALAQPAGTGPSDERAAYPTVRLRPVTGPAQRGRLELRAVALKTEVGGATIDLAPVRRVTFAADPQGAPPTADRRPSGRGPTYARSTSSPTRSRPSGPSSSASSP